jgi:hypothetical protein
MFVAVGDFEFFLATYDEILILCEKQMYSPALFLSLFRPSLFSLNR